MQSGGTMLCSAPLFYEEHEAPYDYFRYTQYAYKILLEEAGFEIVKIEWLEGYMGTLAYQLLSAARNLPFRPPKNFPVVFGWTLAPLIALLKVQFYLLAACFYQADIRYPLKNVGMPKNYVVMARKL